MRGWLRPRARAIGLASLAAIVGLGLLLRSAPGRGDVPLRTPPEHRRPADQTYLTFPEWFLVHSPRELADLLAEEGPGRSPSRFPWMGHVGQLWSSYASVTEAVAAQYPEEPLNVGYHVMILVIASSTTFEYALRGGYETLVGRVAEATQTLGEVHGRTKEDEFGAQYAQEYVDFILERPWYEFDFVHALVRLWTEVPYGGPDRIRGMERRYLLTSELVAKAAYGLLIREGTQASYEAPSPVTAVVVRGLGDPLPSGVELTVLEEFEDGAVLATLPRYDAFGVQATLLAQEGVSFEEVAGNRGPILVSALVRRGSGISTALSAEGSRVLFCQPILTRSREERVVWELPVAQLGALLDRIGSDPRARLEHVYDF